MREVPETSDDYSIYAHRATMNEYYGRDDENCI